MSRPGPALPVLDEAHAAFIQRCVSINVASCDAGKIPEVARALGCRVSSDRCEVTVFLAADTCTGLVSCLEKNGAIAVVFNRPSTHQAIQLKGNSASLKPAEEGDLTIMADYSTSFVDDLMSIGYVESFARAVIPLPVGKLLAVTFMPTEAFVQTPGPNAGQPLRPWQ